MDEIGTVEDIHAIEYAMQCGCRMIASVHGLNMDEASNKPVLGDLIRRRMFQRYVVLGNEKGPGEIREFMMNGGACCAETYREHFSADGNCRSRLSLWGRTERLSQADGISAIYCRDDPGTTGIYRGTVAGTSDGCISENKEPYKSWLEHTARRTAKRTDADFTEIWKGCVEKDLGAAGLKKEHREWIRDFGAFLGQGDRETMGRSIELSMKQMDLMIRQQRGELAGKRKIGNWLGVMSGLFLIILLW